MKVGQLMHDLRVKTYTYDYVGNDFCLCSFCQKAFVGNYLDDLCPDCMESCEVLPWFKGND